MSQPGLSVPSSPRIHACRAIRAYRMGSNQDNACLTLEGGCGAIGSEPCATVLYNWPNPEKRGEEPKSL